MPPYTVMPSAGSTWVSSSREEKSLWSESPAMLLVLPVDDAAAVLAQTLRQTQVVLAVAALAHRPVAELPLGVAHLAPAVRLGVGHLPLIDPYLPWGARGGVVQLQLQQLTVASVVAVSQAVVGSLRGVGQPADLCSVRRRAAGVHNPPQGSAQHGLVAAEHVGHAGAGHLHQLRSHLARHRYPPWLQLPCRSEERRVGKE